MDFATARQLNQAIRLVSIRHRALAVELLAEIGLAPGHDHILLAVDRDGPMTQRQLAAACELSPAMITGLVRQLEEAGLVARAPKVNDARALTVELTAAGRAALGPLRRQIVRHGEITAQALGTTRPEELVAILSDLAAGLAGADLATSEAG